jgi:hypothetical protein
MRDPTQPANVADDAVTRLGGPDSVDLVHHVKVVTVDNYDIAGVRYTVMDFLCNESDCTWQGTRLFGGDPHKLCGAMNELSLDSTDLETFLLEDFGNAETDDSSSSGLDEEYSSDEDYSADEEYSSDEEEDSDSEESSSSMDGSSEPDDEYDESESEDDSEQDEAAHDEDRRIESHPVVIDSDEVLV